MIQTRHSFIFSVISAIFIIYALFLVFHYYYEWNYCSSLSWVVEKESIEEIKTMAKCEDNFFCEVGESHMNNDGKKDFTCIRSIKPKTWKQ